MKKGVCWLVIVLMFSCQKDELDRHVIYQVPDELDIYINTFIQEAKIRGVTIAKENLIVEFITGSTGELCGSCQSKTTKSLQNTIKFTKNRTCWTGAASQSKEALVFHELGHCWLGRSGHRDDLLPNGSPSSIMSTVLEGPYDPCIYVLDNVTDCNKTMRRTYYLDELFNSKTPIPAWAK